MPSEIDGEIAHVAEHQRQFAHFAAEFEPRRIGDDLFHHRRRQIAAERAADGAALLLGLPINVERDRPR